MPETPSETPTFPADEIKEANRYATDLILDRDLSTAYYAELKKAVKDGTYDTQIMDNFLTQKGYHCTFQEVLYAQRNLPSYQLYYWTGTYKTTYTETKADGKVFAIQGGASSGPQIVAYGDLFIIHPKFDNLVLIWDTAENTTSGNLTFTLQATSGGQVIKGFYGEITEGGVQKSITGVETTVEEIEKSGKKTPAGLDLKALQIAGIAVGMTSQLAFLGFLVWQVWSKRKRVRQLESSEQTPETRRQIEGEQEEMRPMERTADRTVQATDPLRERLLQPSDADYQAGVRPVVAGADGGSSLPTTYSPPPRPADPQQEAMIRQGVRTVSEERKGGPSGGGEEEEDSSPLLDEIDHEARPSGELD